MIRYMGVNLKSGEVRTVMSETYEKAVLDLDKSWSRGPRSEKYVRLDSSEKDDADVIVKITPKFVDFRDNEDFSKAIMRATKDIDGVYFKRKEARYTYENVS